MSITLILVIITAAVSISAFKRQDIFDKLVFNPFRIARGGEWYRMISCGLLHADPMHLAINMLVLFVFGEYVEMLYSSSYAFGTWGKLAFLGLYVSATFVANISTLVKHQNNPSYNAVGASGAVSAVTFAAIVFDPWQKYLLMGLIEIPAIIFGISYLAVEFFLSRRSSDSINHDAHFLGAIYGFVFTFALRPELIGFFFQKLINIPG